MLTFKNKEEKEFWKQVILSALPSSKVIDSGDVVESWQIFRDTADIAVEALRRRQPVQQFPEIKE